MPFDDVIGRPDASALIPIEQAREIIQLLPQSSVALRLARRAPNMSAHQRQVPVLSVLPMAYFVTGGDGGLKQTTKTGWEGLMLTAEEIAVIVPIHENVLNDSAYPLWTEIRPQIAAAIGLTLDRAVFFGTNKPASWPNSVDQGARATLPANSMVVPRTTPPPPPRAASLATFPTSTAPSNARDTRSAGCSSTRSIADSSARPATPRATSSPSSSQATCTGSSRPTGCVAAGPPAPPSPKDSPATSRK